MSDPWSRGEHYRASDEMPSAVPPVSGRTGLEHLQSLFAEDAAATEQARAIIAAPLVTDRTIPSFGELEHRPAFRTRSGLARWAYAWWAAHQAVPADEFTRAEQQTRYGLVLAFAVLLAALLVLVFSFLLPALLPSQPPVVTP